MKKAFIKLYFSDLSKLVFLSTISFKKSKIGFRDIIRVILTQIYFTSLQAMPLVIMLSFFMGLIMSFYLSSQYSLLDISFSQNNVLVLIILNQLIPLLTAFLVIARSCTAVASELGNMKVNNEILALESMGISQIQYIVAPRFFAGMISILTLSFYFCIMFIIFMLICCFFIMNNFDAYSFIASIVDETTTLDIVIFVLKNLLIGGIIFIISCINGLSVSIYSTEVPVATINAVVHSIIFCIFASLFFMLINFVITV